MFNWFKRRDKRDAHDGNASDEPQWESLEVSAGERTLALTGKKVEAVRDYRIRTGAGLLDAKLAIDDALEESQGN